MAKAYLGDIEAANCFLGDNVIDTSYLGDTLACDLIPDFEMMITSTAMPMFQNNPGGTLTVRDNNDGTFQVTGDNITKVLFGDNKPISEHITKIHVIRTDTLTSMANMFKIVNVMAPNISFLEEISFAPTVNTSNVTDMSYMFAVDSNGISDTFVSLVGLEYLDTSNVTTLEGTLSMLKIPNIKGAENWNTSKVEVMRNNFSNLPEVTELYLDNWDVSSVLNMNGIFVHCGKLKSISNASWDMSRVTNTQWAFRFNPVLECISRLDTRASTNKLLMFDNCPSLTNPDVAAQTDLADANGANWINTDDCPYPSFKMVITSPVEPMMFVTGGSVHIDDNGDGTWDVWSNDNITSVRFKEDILANTLVTKVVYKRTGTLTYMNNVFAPMGVSHLMTGLTEIIFEDTVDMSKVINWEGCFASIENITHLDLTNITFVTGVMKYMFMGCRKLECITNIDSTNAAEKTSMFGSCNMLIEPDAVARYAIEDTNGLDWVNASPCPIPPNRFQMKVTSIGSPSVTFRGPGNTAVAVDVVDNLDGTFSFSSTEKVDYLRSTGPTVVTAVEIYLAMDLTDIANAWSNHVLLVSFDTSALTSVTDANSSWHGCTGLTSFDSSGLTSVKNIDGAWYDCENLTSFNSAPLVSVTEGNNAWHSCAKIECFNELDTTAWIDKVDMFYHCFALVAPNAAEQANLESASGFTWVNANPCPTVIPIHAGKSAYTIDDRSSGMWDGFNTGAIGHEVMGSGTLINGTDLKLACFCTEGNNDTYIGFTLDGTPPNVLPPTWTQVNVYDSNNVLLGSATSISIQNTLYGVAQFPNGVLQGLFDGTTGQRIFYIERI